MKKYEENKIVDILTMVKDIMYLTKMYITQDTN